MSDPALRKSVVESLRLIGGTVTYRTWSDLRQRLDLVTSNTQLKKAVNSLVYRGEVLARGTGSVDMAAVTLCLPVSRRN